MFRCFTREKTKKGGQNPYHLNAVKSYSYMYNMLIFVILLCGFTLKSTYSNIVKLFFTQFDNKKNISPTWIIMYWGTFINFSSSEKIYA